MSQKKQCGVCQKDFLVIDQEEQFLKQQQWPLPSECPDCRQARRMATRNPRKLFKSTCDKCKKEIIMAFERNSDDIVYCKEDYREFMESSNHLRD